MRAAAARRRPRRVDLLAVCILGHFWQSVLRREAVVELLASSAAASSTSASARDGTAARRRGRAGGGWARRRTRRRRRLCARLLPYGLPGLRVVVVRSAVSCGHLHPVGREVCGLSGLGGRQPPARSRGRKSGACGWHRRRGSSGRLRRREGGAGRWHGRRGWRCWWRRRCSNRHGWRCRHGGRHRRRHWCAAADGRRHGRPWATANGRGRRTAASNFRRCGPSSTRSRRTSTSLFQLWEAARKEASRRRPATTAAAAASSSSAAARSGVALWLTNNTPSTRYNRAIVDVLRLFETLASLNLRHQTAIHG